MQHWLFLPARSHDDHGHHTLGQAEATVGVAIRVVASFPAPQGESGAREQDVVNRIAGHRPATSRDAHHADVKLDRALAIFSCQVGRCPGAAVFDIVPVPDNGVRDGHGRLGHREEAVVAGDKDQRVVRQLAQHAAHVLADDLAHGGVVNESQVLGVVVQVLVAKVKDDVLQLIRDVAHGHARSDRVVILNHFEGWT